MEDFGSDTQKIKPEDIEKALQIIERRDLDLLSDIELQIHGETEWRASDFQFIRINAISKSNPKRDTNVERFLMEDIIAGLYGSKIPFVYLILGTDIEISVYLGILIKDISQKIDGLVTSLYSTFPDIEIAHLNKSDLEIYINQHIKSSQHFGIMTGIPTPKIGCDEYGFEQIERLIRGLYRQKFGYMVISEPIDDRDVVETFNDVSKEIRYYSKTAKVSSQFTKTSREIQSSEDTNKQVQNYIDLLEIALVKLKLGKSNGVWRTASYFFSPDQFTANKMRTLLKVVFGGEDSIPEAIRTFTLSGGKSKEIIEKFLQLKTELDFNPILRGASHPLSRLMQYKFITILNSRDLATLTHLPKEEMPGYKVKDTARFGVCLPKRINSENYIKIGDVIDRGLSTGNTCTIRENDLAKHGLIAGVTGSGKTNSCFYILNQLWRGSSKIPFLVIEPAKKEYRKLINYEGYNDLQIFTLGNENISKFRLNPFELLPGVQVQSHIDHLRAVFNASFIMYSPMPYVLERCIHEIYRDKGWDLVSGNNIHIPSDQNGGEELFPTLSDLNEKIEPIVDNLGYENRITMDVKAALKTRIGSLCIGGKGAMLDTRLSIPIEVILSKPTILELECIGDDEEKAFIIGLLLNRIYEFRKTESENAQSISDLKHVTLIEEAHRLLSNTPQESGNLENINTKSKAVETFCNILAEIRAYNEGILIAEQIPTKLANDAIKNTNLKLMHRIVAKDDRDILGHTMNLSEEQNKYMAIIKKGYGAIFFEGLDKSFLVKIPYFPETAQAKSGIQGEDNIVSDSVIKRSMARLTSDLNNIYAKQKGCLACRDKCKYLDITRQILNNDGITYSYRKYLISIIGDIGNITDRYQFLKDEIFKSIPDVSIQSDSSEGIMFCFFINAGIQYFKLQKKEYMLSNQKYTNLMESYFDLINKLFEVAIRTQLSVKAEKAAARFISNFKETFESETGPFSECNEFCNHKCFFKSNVQPIAYNESIDNGFKECIKNSNPGDGKVRNFCINVARDLIFGEDTEFMKAIALCFYIQKLASWNVEQSIIDIKRDFLLIPEKLI